MASSYTPVAADANTSVKSGSAPVHVFIHRHTCVHCGKASEREITPEMMHAFPYHPPLSAWHSHHMQSLLNLTMNILLLATVVILILIAVKFIFVQ